MISTMIFPICSALLAPPRAPRSTVAGLSNVRADPVRAATFTEKCPACRGSGRFVSYSGRTVGSCFKCKGTGALGIASTVPAQRPSVLSDADKRQITDEAGYRKGSS